MRERDNEIEGKESEKSDTKIKIDRKLCGRRGLSPQ